MRFQVMWKKTHLPPEAYRPFFETDSIDEAKDFAMRLAFDETNHVYVQDTRRDEIVRDFDAPVYRDCPQPPYPSVCPVLSVRTGLFICV